MSQALAARNIKGILDEYERVCDWFTQTYQKEPTTFCRYNDKLDRFEINITVPCGNSYAESNSFIEGPKLYDSGFIQVVKEGIFPNLKRAISKKIEESEKTKDAEKEIQRFIQEKGKVPLFQESQADSRKVLIP